MKDNGIHTPRRKSEAEASSLEGISCEMTLDVRKRKGKRRFTRRVAEYMMLTDINKT